MKSSGLFIFLMFTLTNRSYSKENNVKEVRKGKVVEPRYHFNHPPSVEYYNPIPVAVVYEDNKNFSDKSEIAIVSEEQEVSKDERGGHFFEPRYHLNHPPSVENYNPIPVAIVYEDNTNYSGKSKTTVVSEVENIKPIVINNDENDKTPKNDKQGNSDTLGDDSKTSVKLVTKPRTLNNWQIPVAIVYESGSSNHHNHQKRKTDTSTELSKLQSGHDNQGNFTSHHDKNSFKEQNSQISKKEIVLYPKTDTRVFKKRTEGRDSVIPILEMESYVFSHNGNFHYSYEGGDGTKAYSEGKQVTIDDEARQSVVGGFSYKDKEGTDFSLKYTADENGYRPVGAHLPTPPPIPPAIARALAYLATATPEPVTTRSAESKVLVR